MRYLSILVAVILTMLFTSACQEESQPVVKEAPKNVVEKTKEKVASAVETTEEKTEQVMADIKEGARESMAQAKTETHKMMDTAHEKMDEMHDSMMSSSVSDETLATGKLVYEQNCAACHASGTAGAPKTGDQEAWSAHIHTGMDHMVKSVINGKGAMPARGGNAKLSDDEIEAAVNYMVEESR